MGIFADSKALSCRSINQGVDQKVEDALGKLHLDFGKTLEQIDGLDLAAPKLVALDELASQRHQMVQFDAKAAEAFLNLHYLRAAEYHFCNFVENCFCLNIFVNVDGG